MTLARRNYHVVDVAGGAGPVYSLLIDEDGRVYNKVLDGEESIMWNFKVTPPDLRFEFSREERTHEVVQSGNVSGLIYGGTDGKAIYITYREFAAADLTKPVFFQHLIYNADSMFVRFRNMEIKIHEATHDKVVFAVVGDDLDRADEAMK
jgi:hypothetical protein